MKKLIYIANARMPSERAHGKQIFKTCEALAKICDCFELWLPARPQLPTFRGVDPFVYYGSRSKFVIRKLPTVDFLNYINSMPRLVGALVYFLEEITFDISLILQRSRAEVVYSRSLPAAMIGKLVWGKKASYEVHDISQDLFARSLLSFCLRLLDGVVVISKGLAEEVAELGVKRVLVVPDGVDLREFSTDKARPSGEVVYAGGLTKEKGVYVLLEAAKKLADRGVGFRIAGGILTSSEGQKLQEYIVKNKIGNVVFDGLIEAKKVPSYLSAAGVLVLPNSAKSLNSSLYTSPMKLFEYMAVRRPIVAADTPANREILRHKVNAFLVKPDDPGDLARGIVKVLGDKHMAGVLARHAYIDVKKYTWDRRAQKIVDFIRH